ncbi:MAG: hypothetical protein JXA93_09820 [Anaerolineae bacterium]|nr:hypothetical protein [Anaerolineae bacterium]
MADQDRKQRQEKEYYHGLGMLIGTLLFMPLGIVLFIVLDNPGMLGLGPAIGVSVGLALGEGLYERQQREERK